MARKLTFNIFRYNPQDAESVPHTDTYELEETERMTLYIALTKIRVIEIFTLTLVFRNMRKTLRI